MCVLVPNNPKYMLIITWAVEATPTSIGKLERCSWCGHNVVSLLGQGLAKSALLVHADHGFCFGPSYLICARGSSGPWSQIFPHRNCHWSWNHDESCILGGNVDHGIISSPFLSLPNGMLFHFFWGSCGSIRGQGFGSWRVIPATKRPGHWCHWRWDVSGDRCVSREHVQEKPICWLNLNAKKHPRNLVRRFP